jgi:hypothetical protein
MAISPRVTKSRDVSSFFYWVNVLSVTVYLEELSSYEKNILRGYYIGKTTDPSKAKKLFI